MVFVGCFQGVDLDEVISTCFCAVVVDLHAHIMQVNRNGLGFFPLTCQR